MASRIYRVTPTPINAGGVVSTDGDGGGGQILIDPATGPEQAAPGVFRRAGGNRPEVRAGTPIFLYAQNTIQPNSPGSVNTSALRNSTGAPILIDEIRFSVGTALSSTGSSGLDGMAANFGGSCIFVKLLLSKSRKQLTGNFVPIWGFGTAVDSGEAVYKWRLATPMYLPPGEGIEPLFQHKGFVNTSELVGIGLNGRVMTQGYKPQKLVYPYVTPWVSKIFAASGADSDNSTEEDLINPFEDSLHVVRFCGRHFVLAQNSVTTATQIDEQFSEGTAGNPTVSFNPTVRMVSSKGELLVPGFTDFRQVFSRETRSWEVDYDIDANEYIQAFVKTTTNAAAPYTVIIGQQVHITMVGEREV